MSQLLLCHGIQHVALILRRIQPLFQQVSSTAIFFYTAVMTCYDNIPAQLLPPHKQLRKLDVPVAVDAWIRRFSPLISSDKPVDDLPAEILRIVENVIRNIQLKCRAPGVLHVRQTAAALFAGDPRCLVFEDGRYRMDLDDMERKIREHDVKLFILCSPHNPVGRVWTKDELAAAGRLCEKYDVIVVSDEIHSDFTYGGLTHTVFPSISPQLAERTILCTAPSKTFNLAGLQVSNIFVPDQKLRRAMRRAIDQTGYGNLNMMGLAACQAAYEEGEDWLQDLKRYLTDNLAYLRQRIKEDLPGIRLIEPEGTYLVWLDLRQLDLSEEEQRKLIVDDARLWLDTGTMFGAEGAGFERINIACPRSTLKEAMDRLARALQKKGEA